MDELVVVLVTAPRGKAVEIARVLVNERLAACINIIEGIRSIYWWKGKVEDDSEDLMIIKTIKCLLDPLRDRIRELHPYEVPEIVAIPPSYVLDEYKAWALGEMRECR
ncbi:MAG: divalent-cation tolerance protein CutA [Desulfurococcales archaeon]|nr:divalent-cation tolerance protein CutA [Desulfurococcales archaeon]